MAPTVRAGGPRPQGTDGTDFRFRQTIENKYQVLPQKRKLARRATSLFALLAGLRTVWAAFIPLAAGAPLPEAAVLAAAVAAAAAAAGVAGFAGGRAHKERAGSLAAYPGLVMGAAVALLASAVQDHALTPPSSRRPALAASLAGGVEGVASAAAAVDVALTAGAVVAALAAAAAVRAYTAARAAK